MPCYFEADHSLLTKVENILLQQNIPSHVVGLIASGTNLFLIVKLRQFVNIFPEAMCAEMERLRLHKFVISLRNLVITRSLSDVFQKVRITQFDEYLKKASYASAQMCYALISSL